MANEGMQVERSVTVFGGSGFIGRHVVKALLDDDWRIKIACRRPEAARDLKSLGGPGRIELIYADLRDPNSVAVAVHGAGAVVNLVGILTESTQPRRGRPATGPARSWRRHVLRGFLPED